MIQTTNQFISAGGSIQLSAFRSLLISELPGGPVTLRIAEMSGKGEGRAENIQEGFYFVGDPGQTYRAIIESVNAQSNAVIYSSEGEIGKVQGNMTVAGDVLATVERSNSLLTAVDVVCPAGARTMLHGGGAGVMTLCLSNLGSEDLRFGDSNCAANRGARLAALSDASFDTSAALYVWNPSAVAVSVAVTVMKIV